MSKLIRKHLRVCGYAVLTVLLLTTVGCTRTIDSSTQEMIANISIYRTDEVSKGFTQVAENEYLEMLFESVSTQFCIRDKQSGKLWYSNPQNIEEDTLANEKNKNKLKSQLTIYASTPKGDVLEMNNYEFSTMFNQFQYELIEDGIKIYYTIGKAEQVYGLPQVITAERFEGMILNKLENADEKRTLQGAYKKLELEKITDKKQKEKFLSKYPQLETEILYELRPNQQKFRLEKMSDIVQQVGYTIEDVKYDDEMNGIAIQEENIKFNVAVEYKLDEKDFIVKVPMDEVKYDEKYPITNIKPLEFFGAADSKEKGYMFVPDAAGALIYFNNGKQQVPAYNGKIYGNDYSIIQKEKADMINQVYFPVFGLKNEVGAFIGIVENAEAVATIESDISGKVHLYNNICSNFNIIPNDKIDMTQKTGNSTIKAYQNRTIDEDIQIRYQFINKKDADYVDMANTYRQYLIDKKGLERQQINNLPFVVEYIGAVDVLKHIVGVPVKGIKELTTYEQARKITEEIVAGGVQEISIKYTGMTNGGIYHKVPKRIEFEKCLGSKKEFNELNDFAKEKGINIYPEFDVQYINNNTLLDSYFKYQDSSRLINKEVAEKTPFNYVTYLPDKTKRKVQISTHDFTDRLVEELDKQLDKYQIPGISLSAMGQEVNSDFNENNTIDRQQAVRRIEDQLELIRDKDIMISGGNQYALPYVDLITNMPMTSNAFNIIDEDIPFMQIVLHGYIPYTGGAINLAQDYKKSLLKSIEVGAGLQYTWIYEENYRTKDTDYSKFYATQYKDWIDEAISLYERLNHDLGDVSKETIVGHEKLQEQVYKVTYENGKTIVVNYNNTPIKVRDTQIEAENYAVIEEVKQ